MDVDYCLRRVLFVSRIKILIDVDRRGRGGAGLLPRIAGTGLVGVGTQENTHKLRATAVMTLV